MKFNSIKDIENRVPKKGSFKHMLKRMDEQGRIVKDVNTTADVDTDEIPKQAKKFGNTVDKDGRPPTLSKKVKGSSTNVLYNLGMVKESVDNPAEDSVYLGMLEALGEIDKKSEIYVDMDGVLADFFSRWEEITGKHWRDIQGDDVQPALQAIRDDDDFWLDLKMTANAKNLLSLIKQVKGEYKILSAPLAGDKKAIPHKKEWVKNNLGFFPPTEVIIDADKAKYAKQPDGTPNILIDDFGSNINKWEAAGGIGFKHKDHKFERTAKNIKQAMEKEPVEEWVGVALKGGKYAWQIAKFFWNNKWAITGLTLAYKGISWITDAIDFVQEYLDTPLVRGLVKYGLPAVAVAVALYGGKKLYDELIQAENEKDIEKILKNFNPDAKELEELKKELEAETVKEGSLLKNPKNTFLTKADTAYDFIKLGVNMANLKSMPAGSDVDEPDIMVAPYAGEKEMKYLMKQLKRIGYDVQDAQGYKDAHFDESDVVLDRTQLRNYITDLIIDYVQKEDDIEKLSYMLKNIVGKTVKNRGKRYTISAEDIVLASDGINEITIFSVKRADDAVAENKGFIKATKEDLASYKKIIGLAKKAHETNELEPYFYDAVKITFNMNLYKKYPKLLSTLLKVGRKVTKDDWPNVVKDIKKNTGIDLESHISENFADGKKKGKSRPGRVKRAGASCNGSVTALRKRAKNSSGEKARMYHWCANMKSGRKKK